MRHITNLLIITLVLLSCQACIGGSGKYGQPKEVSQVFEQQAQVRDSLDKLIDAYQAKNLRLFMEQVSGSYTGDADNLESSVRNDFSNLNNISIRYTVNNITPDGNGKSVSLAITFTGNHQVIKTGKMETLTGQTEIVLRKENGRYLLYSMKNPVLFGFSK